MEHVAMFLLVALVASQTAAPEPRPTTPEVFVQAGPAWLVPGSFAAGQPGFELAFGAAVARPADPRAKVNLKLLGLVAVAPGASALAHLTFAPALGAELGGQVFGVSFGFGVGFHARLAPSALVGASALAQVGLYLRPAPRWRLTAHVRDVTALMPTEQTSPALLITLSGVVGLEVSPE